jgi:hypothetical protein
MLPHFSRTPNLSPNIPKRVCISDRIVGGLDGAHQSADLGRVGLPFYLEL